MPEAGNKLPEPLVKWNAIVYNGRCMKIHGERERRDLYGND